MQEMVGKLVARLLVHQVAVAAERDEARARDVRRDAGRRGAPAPSGRRRRQEERRQRSGARREQGGDVPLGHHGERRADVRPGWRERLVAGDDRRRHARAGAAEHAPRRRRRARVARAHAATARREQGAQARPGEAR
jgi:hypothetical protein